MQTEETGLLFSVKNKLQGNVEHNETLCVKTQYNSRKNCLLKLNITPERTEHNE